MADAYDFTTGSIWKKMLLFSGPIFLTNILQTSYQFIDSIWVGNLLGAGALGAISISATVIFTVLSFIIGINSATLTILSQKKGQQDEIGLKKSLNAFTVVLTIMSISFGLIGYAVTDWILRLMGTPEDILPLARSYLHINFLGIIMLFGYNFIGTVLRALGDSRTPIRFVTAAVVLNAFFDPLFISYYDMGIAGAAYATIAAQGVAFFYGLIYSLMKKKVPFIKPYVPEKEYLYALFKVGLPAGLQMMAISAGVMAIMTVVTRFGEDVTAGFGAAQRIDSIIMLPAFTLGSAVNSMAGQNIGAGKWDRVGEIAQKSVMLILTVMFSISAVIFFTGEYLIRLFVDDQGTIEFGALYLQTIAFFYPFLGINFVLNGVVRSSGAMFQVLVLNLISFWVLRYPLSYLFSNWYGERGIAIGMGISLVISSFIAAGYYVYGGWRNVKVFNDKGEGT
ncbi:MATE family efflux transporter [Bacillus marinisedimentorum]|uniref:MATE family efflux transporter n=1 Tax=Bacillus marinisedimentorum TaxID=1821260 RepID=UPI000871B9DD|nr:MATE family efflux transporter [Bacillus marinisedimentorum]